jgi:hypothetical protein
MNFDEVNNIYRHMRDKIYPNVQTVWHDVPTEEVLIDRYLSVIDDNRKYQLLCVPYVVDGELFFKRHKDQCIIFYNTPDPGDGLMLTIHQISPTLHIHSRFFCWVENKQVYDYVSSLVFFRKPDEALKFIDSNFDIAREGNTEENTNAGFNFSSR